MLLVSQIAGVYAICICDTIAYKIVAKKLVFMAILAYFEPKYSCSRFMPSIAPTENASEAVGVKPSKFICFSTNRFASTQNRATVAISVSLDIFSAATVNALIIIT